MKWTKIHLILAAILILPSTAMGWQEEPEEPKLSFNFRDARVETVLKYVCEQLGWNYVYENTSTPSKGTITAISDGEVSPEQALVLLDTALRQHGLATLNPYAPRMPRKGETIKIMTVKDAMKKNLEVRFGSDPENIAPTDKVITQIIPLKGANVASVQKELGDTIKSCIAPDGTYSIDSYSNSLVITGRSEGIRRAALILKVIDVEAVEELKTRVFPLQNADATETSKILAEIFKEEKASSGSSSRGGMGRWMEFFGGGGRGGRSGRGGGGGGSSSPTATSTAGNVVRIIADTRTNSIVAVATEENMTTIKILVEQLDQGSAELIKMKFYPLQYADAEEVAAAVKEMFSEGDSSKSGQQNPWWMGRGRQQQQPEEPVASSREVKAVADIRTNAVIVAASERNFEMIDDLVRSLDRQISDMLVVKVYELQNAEADGMAKILEDIFRPQVNTTRSAGRTQQSGGGGRGGRFMQMMGNSGNSGSSSLSPNDEIEITSDERTNSVIVKASPEYIKIMDEVVDRLDHNPTESTSTYVLPLRFADAPDIAEVIRDLLQGSRSSSSRSTQNSNSGSTRNSGNRNSGNRNSGGNRGGNLGPLEQEEDLQDPIEGDNTRRGVEGDVDVQADEDTNSLVIRTSPRNYEAIQNIVTNLDRLRPQVLIKVLIADVTLDDTMLFGVEGRWENGGLSAEGTDPTSSFLNTDFDLKTIATQGFTYSLTGDEFEGTLKMYAHEGKLKVLATPRILVLDNQTANINIGEQFPVISNSTISSQGDTVNTIRYEDVGISLEVTPHINPDGLVTMEVAPEVSHVSDSTVQITDGLNAARITVNSAQTTVAVHNGQTVIIGGLIRDVVEIVEDKFPILGDIPILGWLFRYKKEVTQRRELMIFLTPYVAYTIAELEELSDVEKAKLKLIDQKDIESESDKWLDKVRY